MTKDVKMYQLTSPRNGGFVTYYTKAVSKQEAEKFFRADLAEKCFINFKIIQVPFNYYDIAPSNFIY